MAAVTETMVPEAGAEKAEATAAAAAAAVVVETETATAARNLLNLIRFADELDSVYFGGKSTLVEPQVARKPAVCTALSWTNNSGASRITGYRPLHRTV